MRFKLVCQLPAQGIVAQGTHGDAVQAKLACMICKVSRGTPKLLTRREFIPKSLSEAYNIFSHDYLRILVT